MSIKLVGSLSKLKGMADKSKISYGDYSPKKLSRSGNRFCLVYIRPETSIFGVYPYLFEVKLCEIFYRRHRVVFRG